MLKLFNVLMGAVVCEWLWRMFGCKVVKLGVGADKDLVRTFFALFTQMAGIWYQETQSYFRSQLTPWSH